MRSVTLGDSGLTSSRLGFGTSTLHHLLTATARQRLLHHVRDLGIRHFDTAPLYGHEQAERELGVFGQGRRTELVFATKFGILPIALLTRFPPLMYGRMVGMGLARKLTGRATALVELVRDYSPRHAIQRVERSLRLLRTDYLDIVFLHEPTLALLSAPEELVRTLEDLRRQGKVRAFGISGTGANCADLAQANPALAQVLQVDANPGSGGLVAVASAGFRACVTFGHVRGMKDPPPTPAGRMREGLRRAARENPDGVILFSSRKAGHVTETVLALEALERQPC